MNSIIIVPVCWSLFVASAGGFTTVANGFHDKNYCERFRKEYVAAMKPTRSACLPLDTGPVTPTHVIQQPPEHNEEPGK